MNIQTYIPAELETLETILQTMAYGNIIEQRTMLARLLEDPSLACDPLSTMTYLARTALNVLKEHLDPTEQEPAPIAIMLPDMREARLMAEIGF